MSFLKRIQALNRYQKCILIVLGVMVLVFTILYSITISREGFDYRESILVPSEVDGNTVYSGKIKRKEAVFTVSADKTVVFRYDDKIYGPYKAVEDPTALPDTEIARATTGVELYCGEEVIFRGGIADWNTNPIVINEDGSYADIGYRFFNGETVTDVYGNVVDPMEPPLTVIFKLMGNPKLTHKGDWGIWFYNVCFCIITAVSILYVDEIFHWNLSFQIRDSHKAEPSEWEVAGRYFFWTVMPVMLLVLFIAGLQ